MATRAGYVSWMAGCFVCHGGDAAWTARNAQGVAARHYHATGHPTWFEGVMSVRYGEDRGGPAQGEERDKDELPDLIADAITDSLDMDWGSRDGARAVVAALVKEGVVRIKP